MAFHGRVNPIQPLHFIAGSTTDLTLDTRGDLWVKAFLILIHLILIAGNMLHPPFHPDLNIPRFPPIFLIPI